jgi:hypothetical protein
MEEAKQIKLSEKQVILVKAINGGKIQSLRTATKKKRKTEPIFKISS